MKFEPGDTVGPYRVTGHIGEGAAGVVYQVVNSVTGRLDAMKILADTNHGDLDQAQRFLREIQLQAKLDHPNIAQVRTAFCEDSTIILVMEHVDGEPLSTVLERGPLAPAAAVKVAQQVLWALGTAHAQGVVHRDVKPANILVDRHGMVKLTDFGLAKQSGDPGQTQQGMAVGTVFYMAPEQVRGLAATDWRADLYAVGVLLYEMLTGRKPFDGVEHYAIMRSHIEKTPPPVSYWAPGLGKGFDGLIGKALQKDPAQRFQSAGEFLTALEKIPVERRRAVGRVWQYSACAAGFAVVLLAAVAIPPALSEAPLEVLALEMPPAPPPPPGALDRTVREVDEPAPARAPALIRVKKTEPDHAPVRRPVRFTASQIQPRESEEVIEPPPAKYATEPPRSLPAAPAIAVIGPAPADSGTVLQPVLPTEKPAGWLRRGLTRVPKFFRRREVAQPDPKP